LVGDLGLSEERDSAAGNGIRIVLNGAARQVQATTLEELCAGLGLDGPRVATALNGEFVARDSRAAARLRDGDAVEVLAPMQGG